MGLIEMLLELFNGFAGNVSVPLGLKDVIECLFHS